MTTRDALLRAVLDHPADDTARLVFADWLDETGKPRDEAQAELIRLQIVPDQMPAFVRLPDPTARVEEILKKWGRGWVPKDVRTPGMEFRVDGCDVWLSDSLPAICLPAVFTFRRGYLEAARFNTHEELLVGPAPRIFSQLFAANPVSEIHIAVEGYEPEIDLHLSHGMSGEWGASVVWCTGSVHTGDFATRREAIEVLLRTFEERLPQIAELTLSRPGPIPF